LLHVLVAAPNVLVLDEPTNDLDLDTLRVLEDHLDGFGGTLIVASHDRYLLDRTCDVIYGLEPDGSISRYLDFDQYHERRLARERAREAAAEPREREDADASAEHNRERQARMREVRSLEGRMERLQAQRDQLHAALATHATDPERLVSLQADLDEVEHELVAAEERWLDLAVD
jgi:ATP-binding cassette subfamily F protein uup